MSATTVRLLQAASEIVGGNGRLCKHLGVTPMLLAAYLTDRRPLPDAILLQAMDIVLTRMNAGGPQAPSPPTNTSRGRKRSSTNA